MGGFDLGYIAPALSTALAMLGLFIDRGNKSFRFVAPIFCLIAVALLAAQVLSESQAKADMKASEERAAAQRASLRQQLDASNAVAERQRADLLSIVDALSVSSVRVSSYVSDILLATPRILADFGLTRLRAGKDLEDLSTADLAKKEILTANRLRSQFAEQSSASARIGTEIWYYTKELDNPNIVKALTELSYPVANKTAVLQQADDLTNAVWYGPDTTLNDFKIVVLSLMRAGIEIQRLGPACKNLAVKSRVIEVGHSRAARDDPPKTVAQIGAAASFADLRDFACS